MNADTFTILRTRGPRLAKLIREDGTIQQHDSARTFDMASRSVADLAALGTVLEILLHRPDCAVVRGNRSARGSVQACGGNSDDVTVQAVLQLLMKADADGLIRTRRQERTGERTM